MHEWHNDTLCNNEWHNDTLCHIEWHNDTLCNNYVKEKLVYATLIFAIR